MLDLRFPFSALVAQDPMRTALLAVAVDPGVGGVLISGHKGTGKSTAVRALSRILPPITIVQGCPYHCDPNDPASMEAECRALFDSGAPIPQRSLPTPLVELPLHATEDRLVGSLHVEAALRTGERRFEPGLLAAAHRGILYVDEVNLLADHLVDALLDAAASGVNTVEREGVSAQHASRFILAGSMNPEEGELRPQLLDRFGLYVHVRGVDDESLRQEIVRRRLAFDQDREAFCKAWAPRDNALAARIERAQERLSSIPVDDAVEPAVKLCAKAVTQGHRAEIVLLKAARALAALLDKQRIELGEIARAARLVLPHRMSGNPLLTPESIDARIDQLLDRALGIAARHAEVEVEQAELDIDEMAESMQVPGSMAAGSIVFEPEKKTSLNGSSTPTSGSASRTSTSTG